MTAHHTHLPGWHPETRLHLDVTVWGLAALTLDTTIQVWFLMYLALSAFTRASERRYWTRHGR